MLENPLRIAFFADTMWRIAAVVAVLLLWAVLQHKAKRKTRLVKVLTVCWLAPLLVLALFAGGAVLFAILAVISGQALSEYARLVSLARPYAIVLQLSSVAGLLLAAFAYRQQLVLVAGAAFLAATLIPILTGSVAGAHQHVSCVLFGYFHVSLPLAVIMLSRQADSWGLQYLLIAGTATALADAGGFIAGSRLGGPKLAPRVSPNKTWAGAAGAVLGAAAGTALFWSISPVGWRWPMMIVLAGVVAVGAIWGDLIESFVKRDFGHKDAGTILAGFGGVLDRFDSYFVAVPLSYLTVLLMT